MSLSVISRDHPLEVCRCISDNVKLFWVNGVCMICRQEVRV